METPLYSVHRISFPSVTVCNYNQIFRTCWFRVRNITCCKVFFELKTFNGFCWTFNSIYHKDKFEYENPEPVYPWRAAQGGKRSGLVVTFNLNKTTHRPNFPHEKGIMVHVGDPREMSERGQIISSNKIGFFSVNPISYVIVPGAKSIEPKYRRCIFDNEIDNVTYYTLPDTSFRYSNCMLECKRRFLYEKCGCVYGAFWPVGKSIECNFSQIKCIGKYTDQSYTVRTFNSQNKEINGTSVICNCTFTCTYVQYDYDVRFSNRSFGHISSNGTEIAEVDIYFHNKVMTKYNNHVLWTWLDLFVHIGGLASLFLGCSFMSAFEFVYFTIVGIIICLKICFNRQLS
ncbi:pickpocket protein 19-like [Condylostylus longicornis]|uniref:pickpocket protein 19-like n=1 Tax=Condylostylus longicornis TaxID=2530218 RepID=UPI00244D9AED|nr:pickpocket protein 19-like [Condylostylus longicornis]